jgi:hypothetical protein
MCMKSFKITLLTLYFNYLVNQTAYFVYWRIIQWTQLPYVIKKKYLFVQFKCFQPREHHGLKLNNTHTHYIVSYNFSYIYKKSIWTFGFVEEISSLQTFSFVGIFNSNTNSLNTAWIINTINISYTCSFRLLILCNLKMVNNKSCYTSFTI